MSGFNDNVIWLAPACAKVRQGVRLAVLERAGRVPENVVRLQPKKRPQGNAAGADPSFAAWQAIYMVLSPRQREDAASLLRVLSAGSLKFDPTP